MEADKAYELASGLRKLAEFIRSQHESLPEDIGVDIQTWIYGPWNGDGTEIKVEMAGITRAGLTGGAKITKEYSEYAFTLKLGFGPVSWAVKAARKEVCHAEVVGQETYEVEEVEGEDLRPRTTVTKTKDIIEWKCDPVLERMVDTSA